MDFSENIKILVVGLGSIGKRHIENFISLGIKNVEVCSEWRKEENYYVGGTLLHMFHDFKTAIDTKPDVVVIANPTSFHAAYVLHAVDKGCHVYVEKPLAVSVEEALPLLDLADRKNVTVAVGCQLRFNPCLEQMKKIVADGSLGGILDVQIHMGEYLPDYHPGEDYRIGYAARRDLGGGVLLTQIHDINYANWLFGELESVYAVGGKVSGLDIDVEDNVNYLLKTAGGAVVSVHQDFLQRRRVRTCTILGENGAVYWDYYANSLRLVSRMGKETELGSGCPLDRNHMFLDAMSDFIRCIQFGFSPRTSLLDGIADLRVVDAVRASMSTGKVVRIA